MDSYKKLCEVGSCLYQSQKYESCVKVLSAAHTLQTNQKGITMKVQLTLANAHAALKHNELAVSLYQVSQYWDYLVKSFELVKWCISEFSFEGLSSDAKRDIHLQCEMKNVQAVSYVCFFLLYNCNYPLHILKRFSVKPFFRMWWLTLDF